MQIHRLYILVLCLLVGSPGAARATYRADFFNTTRPPSITFDKGSHTWTVRNQSIERIIQYDTKTGGLSTKYVRDLVHGKEIHPPLNAEGTLSFAPPILLIPAPLTRWTLTDNPPPIEWNLAGFLDASWQSAALPFRSPTGGNPRWYRCLIPRGTIMAKHAYALLLDHLPFTKAEIYTDGDLLQTITPQDRAGQRVIQIDLPKISRAIGIKLISTSRHALSSSSISIAEVGSAPPALDLSKDWQYMLYSINLGGDGSKVLTIGLDGLKEHEGFSLEVNYQIFPGQEPVVVKWFTFVNHRTTQFLLEKVIYDRWPLDGARIQQTAQEYAVASNDVTNEGMVSLVNSPMGDIYESTADHTVEVSAWPNLVLKTDKPSDTPRSMIGMFHGSVDAGSFLLQLFSGLHIARGSPTSTPSAYSTQSGFGKEISEANCKPLIPTAATLGIKLFLLNNGWQANSSSGSGFYGDWMTNRKPDKFPQGLLGISTLIRENGMRFGLWTTANLLSSGSQAGTEHPEWLIKRANGAYLSGSEPGTLEACFTSGWEDNYSQSMLQLCRELTVSYLKIAGSPIQDGCIEMTHEHPVAYTQAAEMEHWGIFSEKLHKLDPQFLISHGTEGAFADLSSEDDGWISHQVDETTVSSQVKDILAQSETARMEVEKLSQSRPPFTLSASSPCHLSGSGNDSKLDYLLSSAAVSVCNLEITGRMDLITPAESALTAKWIKWNTDNRAWLAFSQALHVADEKGDGVLHLRPALDGRFGYLCVWNRSDSVLTSSASFNPEDTFVKLDDAEFVDTRDGKIITVRRSGRTVTLSISIAPHFYQLIDVRKKP